MVENLKIKTKLSKINRKIEIDYLFFCLIAVAVMFDDSCVMLLSFTSAFIHELGHMVAMLWQGVNIEKIRLMPFGIQIENDKKICNNQKMIIYLSGPVINFILAFASSFFFGIITSSKTFAGVNLIFGFFNLLPIVSLDGGDIFRIFLEKMFDFKIVHNILSITSWFLILILTTLMCFCFFKFHVKFITLFSFIFVFLSYILNFRDE